ncbi:hypothetical protein MKZ38_009841 [Zalerion maritima]|uniref:Uncharacterized protein n=1 Tax=Zalerion maritima TaxID=339359 RepID=A0AAD5RZK5_9PEZI|nr:hypothetical protein MKZ38_009841 [Zalerion maritima]
MSHSPPATTSGSGGRSLRPRPRQSLKAQELAQLSSSPFSEHKALLRIVPTRQGRTESRSRLRESPPGQPGSGASSTKAFSPLPSPTTTAETADSATPPSSQLSRSQQQPQPQLQQQPSATKGNKKKRSRVSTDLAASVPADIAMGSAAANPSGPNSQSFASSFSSEPKFKSKPRPKKAATGHNSGRSSPRINAPGNSGSSIGGGPPKANKLIILPTRRASTLKTPPNDPPPEEENEPEEDEGPKVLVPTFDYYQSNLPPHQIDSGDDESGDGDDGVTSAVLPSASTTASNSAFAAGPGETRRQAKAYLAKEGFYNWSVKKVIQLHEHDQHQYQLQTQHSVYSGTPGGSQASQHSTPSPSIVPKTGGHGHGHGTATGAASINTTGTSTKHLKDPLRLTASGRITRSMSGPSRTRSPRRRLVDAKTAAHDLRMDHQTSVERHRWALRDVVSAATMLETNARNLDVSNSGGSRGMIASERRKLAYRNLVGKHLAMLREIEEEWEAWAAECPKELGAFSVRNGGDGVMPDYGQGK